MTNTTPPSLALVPTLPVLSFNFEQLKAWAAGVAEKYTDLIVTEDGVADAKCDMAEINKAKAAVDTARKEAVRQVSEPIRAFEGQIKEVCGIFDQAYAKLAGQVKAFDEARREEKRRMVKGIICDSLLQAFNDAERMVIPIDDRWLNKAVGIKQVKEEVAAIIQRYIEDEQRRVALDQARRDRSSAIESHVKAMNLRYGFELQITRFLDNQVVNDMAQPLADHLARIETVFAQEAERRQARAVAEAAAAKPATPMPVGASTKPSPPQTQPAAGETKIRAMSIVLEYSAANEERVQACLETLKALCVNFSSRYRQDN